MIKCPGCGAELNYDVSSKQVKCNYCGTKFNPEELKVKVSASKKDTFEANSYSCSQCGAKILTFDETAVTFCSYCGSSAMIEEKLVRQTNPECIIPFSITKEKAINAYKSKINSSLFAPNKMKAKTTIEKFRGIYMPYIIYQISYHGNCDNKGERYSKRVGDYIYYDQYKITTEVDTDYDGIAYDLTSKYYDRFSTAIPYNYKDAVPFNINYVGGYYADAKDIEDNIYDSDAINLVQSQTTKLLQKSIRNYNCVNPQIPLEISKRKTGLFPVYFLGMKDNKKEKIYYAVVNGQTGKVAADIPIDFKKYIFASLLLAIPIYILFNTCIVLTPKKISIYSIVFGIISIIFLNIQLKKKNRQESYLDDKGYQFKNKTEKKSKKSNIFLFKESLGIILIIIVIFLNPVSDLYYYGSSIILLLLILWSFKDLVKLHNDSVSNKLPQLNKRGGDESE